MSGALSRPRLFSRRREFLPANTIELPRRPADGVNAKGFDRVMRLERRMPHSMTDDRHSRSSSGPLREQTMITHELIGTSPAFQDVLKGVEIVASVECTVLLRGETGTGKEVVARAIHEASGRRHNRFVALNCAAIPAALMESELFGHERGAFTGACTQTTGRFQAADRGTLFLDEIGDLPLELQPKLLRVLQEREIERLGSGRTQQVDVRVIAATNQDLRRMVQEGKFRADLYYRLNVFPIELPPLRDRREDIPELAAYFVQKFAERHHKPVDQIPYELMQALMTYDWPGNIRELQNVIERSVIMSQAGVLGSITLEL